MFKRVPQKKRKRLAKEMLIKVGLGNRLAHKPKEMSGGQQQRVGIARAFVAKPEIVFADEPTGNLDSKTTIEVMELIRQMARENQQTIVMVTHDRSLAVYADKVFHILDGKIQCIEGADVYGVPPITKVPEFMEEPKTEEIAEYPEGPEEEELPGPLEEPRKVKVTITRMTKWYKLPTREHRKDRQ